MAPVIWDRKCRWVKGNNIRKVRRKQRGDRRRVADPNKRITMASTCGMRRSDLSNSKAVLGRVVGFNLTRASGIVWSKSKQRRPQLLWSARMDGIRQRIWIPKGKSRSIRMNSNPSRWIISRDRRRGSRLRRLMTMARKGKNQIWLVQKGILRNNLRVRIRRSGNLSLISRRWVWNRRGSLLIWERLVSKMTQSPKKRTSFHSRLTLISPKSKKDSVDLPGYLNFIICSGRWKAGRIRWSGNRGCRLWGGRGRWLRVVWMIRGWVVLGVGSLPLGRRWGWWGGMWQICKLRQKVYSKSRW